MRRYNFRVGHVYGPWNCTLATDRVRHAARIPLVFSAICGLPWRHPSPSIRHCQLPHAIAPL